MRRVVFAALCLSAGFAIGSLSPIGRAFAALLTPTAVNGCLYQSSVPTLASGQTYVFQCDVNGKLITH